MKKVLTKVISILTSAVISASVVFGVPLSEFNGLAAGVSAASTESEVLEAIKKMANGDYGREFKKGNYWNQKVTTACKNGSHDDTDRLYTITVNGGNVGGRQCQGFALAVFDKLFGDGKDNSGDNLDCVVYKYPDPNYKSKKEWLLAKASVGDYVRINPASGMGHSFIYTGKEKSKGDYLYCYHANGVAAANCQIDFNTSNSWRKWSTDAKLTGGDAFIYHKRDYKLTIDSPPSPTPFSAFNDTYIIKDKNDPTKNIRASVPTGAVLGTIPINTVCYVTEICRYYGKGTWGKVTYGGVTGYICLDGSVVTTAPPSNPPDPPAPTGDHYIINKNSSDSTKNIRASASASSQLLGTIPKGTVCWVTQISGQWGKVTYGGVTGYINIYDCGTTTDHQWSGWTTSKAATCTAAGTQKRTCPCGKSEEKTIAATGHSYGSWQTATAASCTAAGTEQRTCSKCGNKETRSVAATGHKYKNETIAGGGTKHTCTVCGYSYTEGSAQKLGDIDDNGKITSADAMWVLYAAAGLKKLTPAQTAAADANKDGKVNSADALLIYYVAAGIKKL